MKKAILFFVLLCMFIPTQSQIVYYVRENGVDDMDRCGVTEDEAFRTVRFAIKQCSALSMIIDVAGTLAHKNDTIPQNKTVTIRCSQPEKAILDVPANETGRHFYLTGNCELKLSNIILQNGNLGDTEYGGAIFAQYAINDDTTIGIPVLKCENTEFLNNACGTAGACYLNGATASFEQCIFSDNKAEYNTTGRGNSGAILAMSKEQPLKMDIKQCLFVNNSAVNTGGAMRIYASSQTDITIENNTFYRNSTYQQGNISLEGTATPLSSENERSITLTNNTISRNTAEKENQTGGIYLKTLNEIVVLRNNLIFGNTYAAIQCNAGSTKLKIAKNNITDNTVAGTSDKGIIMNITGNYDSRTGNLLVNEEEKVIQPTSVAGNYILPDDDLQDNGGATPTLAINEGSCAIDAGTTEQAPLSDQRGCVRKGKPDVGAYENDGEFLHILKNEISPTADIYPNPFQSSIYLNPGIKANSIRIYNLLGQFVLQKTVWNNQADLSLLPPGQYIIVIQSDIVPGKKNILIKSPFNILQ